MPYVQKTMFSIFYEDKPPKFNLLNKLYSLCSKYMESSKNQSNFNYILEIDLCYLYLEE